MFINSVNFLGQRTQSVLADNDQASDTLVGRNVRKNFPGHGMYRGEILSFDAPEQLYLIKYEDGDTEELSPDEVKAIILPVAEKRKETSKPVEKTQKEASKQKHLESVYNRALNDNFINSLFGFNDSLFGFGTGMMGIRIISGGRRARKAAKSKATIKARKEAEAEYAQNADKRPFALKDLSILNRPAWDYYHSLTVATLRLECGQYGIPVTGKKSKLLERLRDKARMLRVTPAAAQASTSPSILQTDASRVRAALAKQLRQKFKYDKRLKRGKNMIIKASVPAVAPSVFEDLFGTFKPGKRVKVTPEYTHSLTHSLTHISNL